jgi:hypothetical protein
MKEKLKASKPKKEREISYKNFTSTVKNAKKKQKNGSELSNVTSNVAHFNSDNEFKFAIGNSSSEKNSLNKEEKL